ncbi:MAG: hypothetical protein ETSY2_18980 [Candidatus Entotheonella gemina]|uniref:Uncharacterized protein n=1 Tax=Candidatus Entotheonella gemina TaxID=1429439 RepID=W4M6Z8_9BACT|nr:MAG: hypothetical protein ETSY2_18980 [Candidatus Entotheonella gemina]
MINAALKAYIEDYKWLEAQVAKSRQEIAEGQGIPHDEAMARLRQHMKARTP